MLKTVKVRPFYSFSEFPRLSHLTTVSFSTQKKWFHIVLLDVKFNRKELIFRFLQ